MRQLVLVVDSGCFVASIYALDVRMAKPLLNGRFFTIVYPGCVSYIHYVARWSLRDMWFVETKLVKLR